MPYQKYTFEEEHDGVVVHTYEITYSAVILPVWYGEDADGHRGERRFEIEDTEITDVILDGEPVGVGALTEEIYSYLMKREELNDLNKWENDYEEE